MKIQLVKSAFTLTFLLGLVSISSAEERIGENEFIKNCAVCHGANGKGEGPILDFLKQAPADLTQIRNRNGGLFPMQAVYDTIVDAGRTRAHGDSEMPIWGERYALEIIAEEGDYGFGPGSRVTTRARVLELVFFLANIQESQ